MASAASKERSSQNTTKRCGALAHERHQDGQAVDVLAVNFDQLQRRQAPAAQPGVDVGVGGLDERGFAHAARAPQQRVVGGKSPRETLGVVGQKIAQPVDAAQQRHLDAIDLAHRDQMRRAGRKNKSVGAPKNRGGASGAGTSLSSAAAIRSSASVARGSSGKTDLSALVMRRIGVEKM